MRHEGKGSTAELQCDLLHPPLPLTLSACPAIWGAPRHQTHRLDTASPLIEGRTPLFGVVSISVPCSTSLGLPSLISQPACTTALAF